MHISVAELDLLLDALSRAAARHESMTAALKPGSHSTGEHDRKAASMRALRAKLLRHKAQNKPLVLA